jgi:hypothetical protein
MDGDVEWMGMLDGWGCWMDGDVDIWTTLTGASIGLSYYLTPDFSKLTESSVWIDAATQVEKCTKHKITN